MTSATNYPRPHRTRARAIKQAASTTYSGAVQRAQRGEVPLSDWVVKVDEIKTRYPKPE